jgi:hypothetical protein
VPGNGVFGQSAVMVHAEKETTMILNENNYIGTINGFSKNDWLPLIELIPKIEKVEQFGDDTEAMKLLEQGILDMNPYEEHPIVQQLQIADVLRLGGLARTLL